MRTERDGKPVWISMDESDEERVERQYKVLHVQGCGQILAHVWDGGDFDPVGGLGVSIFNAEGLRIWSMIIGNDIASDLTDRDAVAEAVRHIKLPRRGQIDIEPFGFDVKEPDAH